MNTDRIVTIIDENSSISLLQSADMIKRTYAVYWFDRHPQIELPEMIGDMLHDPDPSIICRVLDCIGNRKAVEFADDVLSVFENSTGSIAGHAAFTLGKLKYANAAGSLCNRMYTLSDFDQFLGICYALGEIGGKLAEQTLLDALDTYNDEFFFEFIMISLMRTAGSKFLPQIIRRYLNCPESYIEGRESIRWFWRAVDCEHLYNAQSEGFLNQNFQWLTGRQGSLPPLFNLQLPNQLDVDNPEPWLKEFLEVIRKTIREGNGSACKMAIGFINGFYFNRDLLNNRSASALLKEIDFLVACYCRVKTQRDTKVDDVLIEHYPTDSENIQNFLDESFYTSKKGEVDFESLDRFGDHLTESDMDNPKQATTNMLVMLARQSGGEVLDDLLLKLYTGLNSKNDSESQVCREALTFCPLPVIDLLKTKWDTQGVLTGPEIHLLGIIPMQSAAKLLLDVMKNGNKNEMSAAADALTDSGCKEAIDIIANHPEFLSGTIPAGNLNLLRKIWESGDKRNPVMKKSEKKSEQEASIVHILTKKRADKSSENPSNLAGTLLPFSRSSYK